MIAEYKRSLSACPNMNLKLTGFYSNDHWATHLGKQCLFAQNDNADVLPLTNSSQAELFFFVVLGFVFFFVVFGSVLFCFTRNLLPRLSN